MNIKIGATFLLLPLLAACTDLPEYQRAAPPIAASWPTPLAAVGGRKSADIDWRSFYPDARLQALIAAALEHNSDLRIAVARVEEARALAGIAHADRWPGANLGASRSAALTPGDLSLTGQPLDSQRYDVGLSMTAFELDFWGRVKNLDASARANYLASAEAQRAFRLSLVADVANAYLTLLEMDERTVLAGATLASRVETRTLIDKRRQVGLASDLDFLQADGAMESARAELANLERQRAAADNALVLLVGQMPSALPPGKPLATQGIVADLDAGLPSEVLLARPDILVAEQKLVAAHANIGAARAAFLPKILLTASLGTASQTLAGLFVGGSRAWSFQPVLSLPLFDAGRTAANVDLAEARETIAIAEYEKTIQQAFREVADLLAARTQLATQLNAVVLANSFRSERR